MVEILSDYAKSFLGLPYTWTGDDPISGFDCSGLVSEILRASGVVPWNFRTNAQGIYDKFVSNSSSNVYQPGALAFYGPSVSQIGHVGFLISPHLMIEAGGGNSETTTDQVRIEKNAFVRIRPVKYRRDFLITLRPYYPGSI
jgi:cell wall-associated NlpC family hydrolase